MPTCTTHVQCFSRMRQGGVLGGRSRVKIVSAEETNHEACHSTAMKHWNGHDEARSAGTQLPPIYHCRKWFDRTTEQHIARLFNRLEIWQRQRRRRSCLNPPEPVLPIDDGNREQTSEPPEVESGERRRVDGRRAPTPGRFGIAEPPECVNQRGLRFDSLTGRSARAGVRSARIAT
jgi:hypothetical protein